MSKEIRLSVKLDPADVEKGEKAIRDALKRLGVEHDVLKKKSKENKDEQAQQAKGFKQTAASLDPLIRAQQKYIREQALLTAGAKAAGASQADLNRLLALAKDRFNAAIASQVEFNRSLALSKERLNDAGKSSGGFVSSLMSMRGALVGLGVGAAVAQLKRFAEAGLEAREAVFRLNFAIGQRPGAGFDVGKLSATAERLKGASPFDDEPILEAMAALARFESVGGHNIERMTKLAVDFAVTMRTDVVSAATMLGKALDEPGQGLKALTDAIGYLEPEFKKLISDLMAAGREAEASALLFGKLEQGVGGMAEKFSKEAPGAWQQFKVYVGDANEGLGEFLIKISEGIDKIPNFLRLLTPITALKAKAPDFKGFINDWADWMVPDRKSAWETGLGQAASTAKPAPLIPPVTEAQVKSFRAHLDNIVEGYKEMDKAAKDGSASFNKALKEEADAAKAFVAANQARIDSTQDLIDSYDTHGAAMRRFYEVEAELIFAEIRGVQGATAALLELAKARGMALLQNAGLAPGQLKLIDTSDAALAATLSEKIVLSSEDLVRNYDAIDAKWQSWIGAAGTVAGLVGQISESAGQWLGAMVNIAAEWRNISKAQRDYDAAVIAGDVDAQNEARAAQTAASMNQWISLFTAVLDIQSADAAKAKLRQYDTYSSVSLNNKGVYETEYPWGDRSGAASAMSKAIIALLKDLQEATGVFVEGMADISTYIRNDGKQFIVQFGGEILGYFRSAEEAMVAAAKAVFTKGELSGTLSQAMREMFTNFAATTVDELKGAVDYIKQIEQIAAGTSDIDFALSSLVNNIKQVMANLRQFGVSALESFRLSGQFGIATARDMWNQISGQQMSPKEEREQAVLRTKMLVLQLQLWKVELQARLAFLQGSGRLLRTEFGGGGGAAGGLRGNALKAQASFMQAEVKLQSSYLSAKAQGVNALGTIYQAEIDLINQLIAGIDALLADIDINKIRIGGRGAGGRAGGGKSTDDFWNLVVGALSPLDPMKQLRASEIRYESALGGKDKGEIEEARRMYLEQAQLVFGGTARYAEIFERVMEQTKFLGTLNSREAQARQLTIDQLWRLAKTANVATRSLANLFGVKAPASNLAPAFSSAFAKGGSDSYGSTLNSGGSIGGNFDTSSIVTAQNSGTAAVVEQLSQVVEEQRKTRRRLSSPGGPTAPAPTAPPPPTGTTATYSGGTKGTFERVM